MSFHNLENNRELSSFWNHQEFEGLDLGDVRLNKRLLTVAEALEAHPGSLINSACGDWASVKAAYRLFDNEKVSAEKILEPHFERTLERMRENRRVFAIQDTTYLNYTDHPSTGGLGPIGAKSKKLHGLVKHTTLIVNDAGLPLGLLTDKVWARESCEQRAPKFRPLIEKESYKWIEALSPLRSDTLADVEVICVCDREADVYEFFVEAKALPFVIRAAQDRVIDDDVGKLWTLVRSQPVAGEITAQVPMRGSQPARKTTLSVHFTAATLRPPHRSQASRSQELPAIDVYLVWVVETNPPEGVPPLEWLLITNVEVSDYTDAVERINWYRHRWQIEVYFKVLKSGTKVEAVRLQTKDRLLRCIALLSVIAWRLYWLSHINRHSPEADCTSVLTETEWHALYCITHKTHIFPEKIPKVSEAVIWIAKLGGFLARKSDGNPGVTVIWRGWKRLNDIAATFAIFQGVGQNDTS